LANGDDPVRPGLGPAEPPAREYFRAALAIILALAFLAEIVGAIVFLSISPFELDDTIGALKNLRRFSSALQWHWSALRPDSISGN
jgi:hypothetical protein